jgi:predicted nucleic acid-binding protein
VARVLIDTSAIFALVDRNDANHAAARAGLAVLQKRRAEPLLTNFIVAESHALLLARLGGTIARRWLLENAWAVERVMEEDEARARAIIARYADKTYSYTDATSFAVMERRGLKLAFAFDPHFRQHGFQLVDADR